MKNNSPSRTPNSVPSFPELIARAAEYAADTMHQLSFVPPLLYATNENHLFFCSTGVPHDWATDYFVEAARLLCIAEQVNAVMVLFQVGAKFKQSGPDRSLTSKPAGPNESLILLAETADQNIHKQLPIIRTAEGDFFGFGDAQTLAHVPDARFTGLLPQNDASPEERTRAKEELQNMEWVVLRVLA